MPQYFLACLKKLFSFIICLSCLLLVSKNLTYAQSSGGGPQSVADQVRGCRINDIIKRDCIKQFCELKEQAYKELAYVFTPSQVDEVCRQLTGSVVAVPTKTTTVKPRPTPTAVQASPIPTLSPNQISPTPSSVAAQEQPRNLFQKVVEFFTNFFSGLFKK